MLLILSCLSNDRDEKEGRLHAEELKVEVTTNFNLDRPGKE